MSRKRPATDPPPAPEPQESPDPLTRILQVLNDTMATRHALLVHSQSVQGCLHIADNLHRTLLGVYDNTCQRITSGTSEQASLQELATAVGATSNAGALPLPHTALQQLGVLGAASIASASTGAGSSSGNPVDLRATLDVSATDLLSIQGVIPMPHAEAAALRSLDAAAMPPPPPRERSGTTLVRPTGSSSSAAPSGGASLDAVGSPGHLAESPTAGAASTQPAADGVPAQPPAPGSEDAPPP